MKEQFNKFNKMDEIEEESMNDSQLQARKSENKKSMYLVKQSSRVGALNHAKAAESMKIKGDDILRRHLEYPLL